MQSDLLVMQIAHKTMHTYIPDCNARCSLCESRNYMPDTDWIWPSTKYKWY